MCLRTEEALDDPVLERVEADHGEPAAGPQHLERRGQRGLERAELVVDGDPQRLEDALRRMAVAEARRRRDRLLDRLDEVARALERLLAAASHDRAGDLPRVALLAVAAEDLCELALARLVHELACRELRGRVHAHVERRVGRVREAALGPVELHRRDAEVEQDRVRAARRCRRAGSSTTEKSPRRNRACTPARRLEAVEVRARGRVAVDRDQLAAAAQVGCQQLGVAAGAEGGVDDGLPGLDREELAHLLGEDGDVISRVGCKTFGNILCAPFHLVQLLAPLGAIPDLEVVVDAGDDDVPSEPGVPVQSGRHEHAPLLVELRLGRAGEEEPLQLARLLAERVERRERATGTERVPVARAIDVEAAVDAARDDDAARPTRRGTWPEA